MKVAYVLGTSAGGTVRHVRMLATGLAGRGVDVTVYGPAQTWAEGGSAGASAEAPGRGSGGASAEAAEGGSVRASAEAVRFEPVEIAERPRPVRDLAAVWRLRALLRRARPDVVHAHGLRAGAVAALAVGPRRPPPPTASNRPPLVVTVHNAAPAGGLAGLVYRGLERLVARRAGRVLCVSTDLEARMRALGARNVGRALVPAPPPAGASATVLAGASAPVPADLAAGGAPVVLAVARLAPQKGLGTLVEAAGRWRDREPAPLVAFAGAGPLLGELTEAARAAGVRARFLGQRDDVPALLAAADVVVLPSLWEGQPLIVHEALRAGRPLVASRTGGIGDLTGADAALLVPPGDAAALSAAIVSVLDDPELAARLSEAAVKRAAGLPTGDDALDAALAAYQATLAG